MGRGGWFGLVLYIVGIADIVGAFDTEWTRLWSTSHDGDDTIEKELLTRLAATKEEHGESEASFCSARYYRPLVHPLSYGNQILSMGPHLVAAKLMRRIYLLEPLHTHHISKGEPVSFSKMLDADGVSNFVGMAVPSEEFGRCADGNSKQSQHVKPKMIKGKLVKQAPQVPTSDLLFKYGTNPTCNLAESAYVQSWDRDEFLRQCSGVPHGVNANTWARVMWLISNGEATEVAAMAAFALCPAVRNKEVVSFCPRNVVFSLDFPSANQGVFNGASSSGAGMMNNIGDFAQSQGSASVRSKFTNHSTPCVRHFTNPNEDDDNGGDGAPRKKGKHASHSTDCGASNCAVDTYCRMIRQSTVALRSNLWTVKLGRWMIGELKNMASQAAQVSALQYKERKELLKKELEEDEEIEESRNKEVEARMAAAAREKEMKSEARGISYRGRRRQLLAKPAPPALPPMVTGPPIATRGFILGLHIRMGDCYNMMDPATWKKQCVNTKGFGPEHVPILVRAVTRLITDGKVPVPAAIYVATNWAGIFKLFPRELWHAHGVTRVFGWADLQTRVGGEFKDYNVVLLEQEILRLADGGSVVGLHSSIALWTAERRWFGFNDELVPFGENKHNDNRPTRAVFSLEELHDHEEELRRTSLAISGSPLDLFNETATNAVCREGMGYPPNSCPCVAMRQEYGVSSGRGFGALPKSLYKSWGQLKCDAVLCEALRPREQAAARTGEKFPCKRKFYDEVLRFPVKSSDANKKKKRKKKMVQIK